MKRSLLLSVLVFFLLSVSSYGQVTEKLDLISDGNIFLSQPTKANDLYRITVEGTYSMWPQYADCHGVDGLYVYDVPQEEIDAFRWPPKSFKIANIEVPFVEIPHWVGDEKLYSFPPKEILTPLFDLSFRKYLGFRIDDEPLPNVGLNTATHRYQIEKVGNGQPFKFQILDSTFNIIQEKVIPRYEDNCGKLIVTIEEVNPEKDINICDVGTICVDNVIVGLRLSAAIFAADSTKTSGKKNLLKEISLNQLGIVYNGEFICDIDSIVCERTIPISLGLLVDRSTSMRGAISTTDQTPRIDASKSAIGSFIDKLKPQDSSFVMTFANDITLDQDWTNDKTKLKTSVNNINPNGLTAFYDAVLEALDKVSTSASPVRALVVLSDGARTTGSEWDDSFLQKISQKNIPIFIIALGFTTDPQDIEGREKIQLIANASRGKAFDVYNSGKLDSVYNQLGDEIGDDECCTIYFKIEGCDDSKDNFLKIIYAPSDTVLLTKVVKFSCKCDSGGVVEVIDFNDNDFDSDIEFHPNPVNDLGKVIFSITQSSKVSLSITSISGVTVFTHDLGNLDFGRYTFDINTSKFKSGTYILNVLQNSTISSRKIIILH